MKYLTIQSGRLRLLLTLVVVLQGLLACDRMPNDPYPSAESGKNILYSAFTERPKHLDPAQSYSENEITFTAQIYQPLLQYHFIKRPYELVPYTLENLPTVRYVDQNGQELPQDTPAQDVHKSIYEFRLKMGILYQPHPAFALGADKKPLYLGDDAIGDRHSIGDFEQTGTRELTAADYIYQIKRLAHPRLHSPIYGMMAEYIVGLKELTTQLKAADQVDSSAWLDLDQFDLSGIELIDDYSWRIHIRGKYPQFRYWLAMPFFSPIPREADRFYSQKIMQERNLTLDWWPIGTGPYMLSENDPNQRMVLSRNPNFSGENYPCSGSDQDKSSGLLDDCGKALPLIEQVVFSREKESIPYWNKFLQGYYDASGISEDSFDQAIRVNVSGDANLSDTMQSKGVSLLTAVKPSTFYLGFNMLDSVVGGLSEQKTKLRQAISIALDIEEYISIFNNGRGLPGHSPLPPGMFGYLEGSAGINPYVYDWVQGKARRKSLSEARRLLREAGYPDGRDESTGEPLVLYLDTTSGGFGEKSRLDWLTRQFKAINVQLVVRDTDYNRYQDKLRKGRVQLFFLGWNADYPDPENFFFLLHGAESKAKNNGENSANYSNPKYDELFAMMKHMDNTPERLEIIQQMNTILQHDAPWIFWLHPQSYVLTHEWLKNRIPNTIANNTLKYQRLDTSLRQQKREEWNRPVLTPIWFLLGLLVLFITMWSVWRLLRKRPQ